MSITSSGNFKIENSTLTNVNGNATIFKFDGGGPFTEEFKSMILQHMTGSVTVKDLDKVEKRILSQSISNIPRANAAYNDYAVENRKRAVCFEGTRRSVLLEIGEWAVDLNGALFYVLFGIAGVGKSTIAQTFSEKADILRLLGASFFFSRNEADRRNAAKFFTTIALQLCLFNEGFARVIGQILSQERGIAAVTKDPNEQLTVLILEPLRNVVKPSPLPIIITVDALDECDERDRAVILGGLTRLVQELPSFKVFLTTRPHPSILGGGNPRKVFRLEDVEEKVVDSDIRIYLKHCLSYEQVKQALPGLRQAWSASDNDIEFLVRAAGQLFIVASTTVRFILDTIARKPASRMKKLLNTSTRGGAPLRALNGFYTVILRCAVPEHCDDDILEDYQAVVGAILVIQTPLPIGSLAELIDVSEECISAVLDNLQSVISLSSDDIPLIRHKSFSDYITNPERCRDKDLRITPRDHHTRMATCCLQVMNKKLRRNILSLGVPAQYLDNDEALKEERISEDQLSEKISADLQYACVYWATHVADADIKTTELMEELKSFADNHLMHWFEALSWVCQLDIAYRALSILVDLLRSTSDDMCATFYDALRFVGKSFGDICRSALHTYHSALPFMPTERPMYQKYKKEMTHEVIGGPEEWDAEIANLRLGVSIADLAFSRDGSQFSLLWKTGDFLRSEVMVKLCNATSGIPVATYNTGGSTIALAGDFSVVASSKGREVMLRSIARNTPLATFQHSKNVVALALSFDCSQLAAGLYNGEINLWDARKEEVLATHHVRASSDRLYDHALQGHSLALFFGGDLLASAMLQDVKLWNVVNGELVCHFVCESPLSQLLFYHGDCRLASLDDDALQVWDVETGKRIGLVKCSASMFAVSGDGSLLATPELVKRGYQVKLWGGDSLLVVDTFNVRKEITCLAFSKNLLAIGFVETVELYDIKKHSFISVFNAWGIKSLAFSPLSTRLIGADPYGHVRLWDVSNIKASVPASKIQTEVTALAFSPDCSRLASGFEDGTVQLWNTTFPAHVINVHMLHYHPIVKLVFSSDGKRLASLQSHGSNCRIYDGKNGSLIALFKLSGAFSGNGLLDVSCHLLAIGAAGRTDVWDHKSSRAVGTLDGNTSSISFSPDGSLLATVGQLDTSLSFSVAVWEVERDTMILKFQSNLSLVMMNPSSFPNLSGKPIMFSPDASKLVIVKSEAYALIDLVDEKIYNAPSYEDLSQIPGLLVKEPPMTYSVNYISRRFSQRYQNVPVLRLPGNVEVTKFVEGSSSMLALGCRDGRVLIIRLSNTSTTQ